MAIGFRMNLFNIGVDGQYRLAAMLAAAVGGAIALPAPLHVLTIVVVAMLVGGFWAGIAGVLKVTRGVSEVISTIMLNFIATAIVAYLLTTDRLAVQVEGSNNIGTEPIPPSGQMPGIPLIPGSSAPVFGFLIVAILAGVAFWFLLGRTRFGFDLRATGMSESAAVASGVSVRRMIVLTMFISGALAGLVGHTGSGTTTWRSKRPAAAGPGRGCRAGWWPPSSRCRSASNPSISDEDLVERLLALVVPAAEAGAALAADRVDLVDEDDRRRLLRGGLEQVAHAAGADADEHLHEVGAGDREERHARLAGDRAGDQRLARARRADEQHALGDAGADLPELLWVLQEVDDLRDLVLHALVAGDVGEGRPGRSVVYALAATCRSHDPAHLPRRPPVHPPEHADDEGGEEEERQPGLKEPGGRRVEADLDVLLAQQREVVL